MKHDISTRKMVAGDYAFILNSWLHSYYDSSEFAKLLSYSVFFEHHRKAVETLLQREQTTVLVATTPDTDDVILGYIAYEERPAYNILHYIYIKRAFGSFGLCQQLISALPFELDHLVFASHETYKGRKKIIDKYKLVFSPYMI